MDHEEWDAYGFHSSLCEVASALMQLVSIGRLWLDGKSLYFKTYMQRFSKVKILLKRSTLSDGGMGLLKHCREALTWNAWVPSEKQHYLHDLTSKL